MKSKLKSVFIIALWGGFLAFFVSACGADDIKMPNVFSGSEVPREVLDAPRLVAKPTETDLNLVPWPRLGDVPSKPNDFSPKPVLDQAVSEMHHERDENEHIRNDYENLTTTPPLSKNQN